jgi:hydrogenase maturation protease
MKEELPMKVLVFGAGNLLLSDEGFGVHLIRYLEEHYATPPEVELYDAGTMGILAIHKLEEAERVIVVDTVAAQGAPGDILCYDKQEIMLDRLPVKLSPHQIGIQEVLALSELRGVGPERLTLIGVIAESLEPGSELSWVLRQRLPEVARMVVEEIRGEGAEIYGRAA